MVQNVFSPFSESATGVPIVVPSTSNSTPGTLIHTTSNEQDSIWLWAGQSEDTPYTETVWMRIVKGNTSLGYTEDVPIKIPAGRKVLIENGIILTGNAEFRVYIDNALSTATNLPNIVITGYVHRRI